MRGNSGFTLVELMATLAVIGLATAAVVLTLPDERAALVQEGDTFATRLVRAREEAILGRRAIEVTVTSQGYGFTRRRLGVWKPLNQKPFGNVLWLEGTTPALPRERGQRVFRFDPTGVAQAQSLTLRRNEAVFRVDVDATGNVRIDDAPH